ncbi:hypothetical protein [Rhodothermus bifroesti]|uniref:Uncharacterized protein n=1 Tax=Rhodothermus marinus TaxID=29549 RepID=A0A7V2B1F9_RHOMR|nr:hypothetical protein [Rhodothermus bifroesti]GBD01591.1 hypothetical protein HRbin18_01317 [bacterium HR18]
MALENSTTLQVARLTAFATLGTLSATQALIGRVWEALEGVDPERLAEETLCLVATATARALEVGLQAASALRQAVVAALLELPLTYRDYLLGEVLLEGEDHRDLEAAGQEVYSRLERMLTFYQAHLPAGQFPGERLLAEKMALWMGRISPPGLPELPQARMERLDVVPLLHAHLRLVLMFGRHVAAEASVG